MDDNKTFTQEEVNAVIKERLDRNEKKWQEKYANYLSPEDVANQKECLQKQIAELTKFIEDGKKKTEDDANMISELQKQLKAHEISALKVKVASEFGLPTELAARLNGETEDEFKKDAETLKQFMSKSTTMPLRNPEPENLPDEKSIELKNLLGSLRNK